MARSKSTYELLKTAMSVVKSKNETPGLLITHHSFTHHFIRKGAFTLGGPAFPLIVGGGSGNTWRGWQGLAAFFSVIFVNFVRNKSIPILIIDLARLAELTPTFCSSSRRSYD